MARLPSQASFVIAFGFLINFMAGPGQTGFISLFSASLQEAMRLSAGELGTLYSLATLGAALALLLVGALIDRAGFRTATWIILGTFTAGGLVLASAQSWLAVFAGYFLIRASANGSFPILSRSLISLQFTRERGRALALAQMGTPIGEAFMPTLAMLCLGIIGWRSTWLGIAMLFPLLCAPFLFFFLKNAQKLKVPAALEPAEANEEMEIAPILPVTGLAEILRDPRLLLLMLPFLYTPFTLSGLFFYSQALVDEKGWTMDWIAHGFAAYGLLHVAGILCVGRLIDRFGARAVLAFHMLPMMLGVMLIAEIDAPYIVFFYFGLSGLSVGFGGTTKAALWPELYGTAFIARLNSLASSVFTLSTALGPPCFGFLIDHGVGVGWILDGTAALGAICTIAAIIFLKLTPKKRTGRF